MTDVTHQDITARLRAEAAGIEEWAIMDPATGAYCMWFDRDESVNPAREAEAWLAQHKRDWPEKFGKYEVVRQVRKSQRDLMEIEAADEIDRLRAEVEALSVDAERYRTLRSVWLDLAPLERRTNTETGRTIYRINMAGDLEALDAALDAARKE